MSGPELQPRKRQPFSLPEGVAAALGPFRIVVPRHDVIPTAERIHHALDRADLPVRTEIRQVAAEDDEIQAVQTVDVRDAAAEVLHGTGAEGEVVVRDEGEADRFLRRQDGRQEQQRREHGKGLFHFHGANVTFFCHFYLNLKAKHNSNTFYIMRKNQYLSPSLRWTDLRAERNFLASGEGENAEPTPGTWSFFDELEME